MGVRGLIKYLTTGGYIQKGQLENTRIVVDGQNVLFFLFRQVFTEDCSVNGGDYPDLAASVRTMLNKMSSCGLEPILVFDGVNSIDEFSWRQVRQRNEWKLNDLIQNGFIAAFLHAIPVAVKVLREYDVEVLQADGSADGTIAQVGHELNCPILSGDGDFLLYGTRGGVALLDDGESSLHDVTNKLTVNVWQYQKFKSDRNLSIFSATITYLFEKSDKRNFRDIANVVETADPSQVYARYGGMGHISFEEFVRKIASFKLEETTELYKYLCSDVCSLKTFCGFPMPPEY